MLHRTKLAVLLVISVVALKAQAVISARSGVVQYLEGTVTLDGTTLVPKIAEFPEVKRGQVLAAEEGRAEVLLTPGVFLRVAENSSFRMVSNALSDTRVEVLTGSVLVEAGDLLENNAVRFIVGESQISLPRSGIYRIDANPARLRVIDGRAVVTNETSEKQKPVTAKKGTSVDLSSSVLAQNKFDPKETDPFYRWSSRRASYVAAANVTASRVAGRSYSAGSGFLGRSSWYWNPYFGMYTFMPGSGISFSPFGHPYYGPGVFTTFYIPRYRPGGLSGIRGYASRPSMPITGAPAPPVGIGGLRGGGGMAAPVGGGMSRGAAGGALRGLGAARAAGR